MEIRSIPVDELQPRDDARPVNLARVGELKKSIQVLGLINPVLVRRREFYWEIIAGRHRTDACRQLKWAEIPCHIAEHDDDAHAELAMIDENLARSGLGYGDQIEQVGRRIELYEQLNPASNGRRQRARAANRAMGHDVSDSQTLTSTAATAEALGMGLRKVQRANAHYRQIAPQVRDLLRGTPFDTQATYEAIKGRPLEGQVDFARQLVGGGTPPRHYTNPIIVAYRRASASERSEFLNELRNLA